MNKNNIKNGYSLIEVIISVAVFTIFFASIVWGFSSLIKLEIKSKDNIYNKIYETDEIIKKHYIRQD